MRVLVNYDKAEAAYLSPLAAMLGEFQMEGLSTKAPSRLDELMYKAQAANVDAIIVCNTETLKNLVPGDKPSLDAWRGSVLRFPIPILIVNSLFHLHSVPYGAWLLRSDLRKLTQLSQPAFHCEWTVLKTVEQLDDAADDFENAVFGAYDIETKTRDYTDKEFAKAKETGEVLEARPTLLTCAGWTLLMPDQSVKTYVLPICNYDGIHWQSNPELQRAFSFLRFANSRKFPKAMHNGMYDATHSIVYHAEPLNWVYDTMGMAHSEFSELPKTLDFVASLHLHDYVYWKAEAKEATKAKDQEQYWGYNAKDTWYTLRIALSQLKTAPAYAFSNYKTQFKLVYPCLYGNFEGLKIDQEERNRSRSKELKKLQGNLGKLRTVFADESFNPGSWQQVEKYIYKVFGAQKPGVSKSNSETDEKSLLAVSAQHPILARICQAILHYREAQKAIGTYYDFVQKNGRLLWNLNPFGTETGRMSAQASSFWCGTQIQNIPEYAKSMLVADEGYILFEIDNSQSEARCVGYLAKEYNLTDALENPERDFYTSLGTMFFNIPYEEVTKDFRNKVLKRVVHGRNYMMGAGTFINTVTPKVLFEAAQRLSISIVEDSKKKIVENAQRMTLKNFASFLLSSYNKPFPRVAEWYKEIYAEISTTQKLTSPLGWVRRFFGDIKKSYSVLQAAVAHGPQNLSVQVLNKGYWKVYKQVVIPSNGAVRLKAQIHDSIFGQIREELAEEMLPKIQALCDNPVIIHGRELRIPTDLKTGKRWKESKE